jgi:two-component system phosphate regulon response regulator PhoB
MDPKVLIVEDEPDVAELIAINLKRNGFLPVKAQNADEAFRCIEGGLPALVLLDIMLPDSSGMEICRQLKSVPATAKIPVIIVSAKGEEADKVRGLELGADDYVTKPFSPRELILRVKGVLRRAMEPGGPIEYLECGVLSLDRTHHRARCNGENLDLTPTEFKLLGLLMERRGRVQTRDRLLSDVWEYEAAIDTRTVDTHMRRLREKLGDAAAHLETVRGVGYRFVEQIDQGD